MAKKYLSLTRFTLSLSIFCSLAIGAVGFTKTAAASTPEREWTFLIFLNGNNNLDSFGSMNLNQIEKVGSNDKVNVVVQWASLKNKKVQRLFMQKDNNPRKVTSPVVQDLGKADMGDWRSLVDFVQWGMTNYPAKHYFLDVWDHGSGWHSISAKAKSAGFHPSDISWDDTTGNFISTKQLGQAMKEISSFLGRKFDVYGSDACLMAMAEVASEMKDSVAYFVGSQELEPGEGWPYDDFLKALNSKTSEVSPAEFSTILTEEYKKAYQGGQYGKKEITLSAFDLSKTDALHQAVAALGQRLAAIDPSVRKDVITAARATQYFFYEDYGDMIDFLDQMEKKNIDLGQRVGNDIRTAVNSYVIANAVTKDYQRAHGVAFWIPSNMSTYRSYIDRYSDLEFQTQTNWADALRSVLQDGTAVDAIAGLSIPFFSR